MTEMNDQPSNAIDSNTLLAELIEQGWNSATTMPDTDRLVQIAWEDGSTRDETLGFADSVSSIPQQPKRYWWYKMRKLEDGEVLAWREINTANDNVQ